MIRPEFRFNRSSIHRPILQFWNQEGIGACVVGERAPMVAIISLSWGSPHSDPVWGIDVYLPTWLAERLPPRG